MSMARNRPAESVAVCRAVPPLATSTILIVASGIMPPDASTTAPVIFCDCAIIGCAIAVSRIAERIKIFATLKFRFILTSSLLVRGSYEQRVGVPLITQDAATAALPKSKYLWCLVYVSPNLLGKQARSRRGLGFNLGVSP